MTDNNPFQAPQSDITIDTGESKLLASRGERFAAALIDTFIALAIVIMPFMYFIGTFDVIAAGEEVPLSMIVTSTIFGFLAYIAINYHFIKKNGQSIGKKVMNIRIENRDGTVASFNTIIFKRYLFSTVISIIPVAGNFLPVIDVLFIFRKSRYCLHDDVALTQVSKCG